MDPADKKKIQSNYVFLNSDLEVKEDFLAEMLDRGAITQSHHDDLMEELKMKKRKSDFLSLIQKRGPKAFRIFIESLLATGQEFIAEKLDPHLTRQCQAESGNNTAELGTTLMPIQEVTTKEVTPGGASGGKENLDYGGEGESEPLKSPGLNFKPIGIESSSPEDGDLLLGQNMKELNKRDPAVAALLNNPNVYKVPRGQAVIVNNEIFSGNLGDRSGSMFDEVNLSELLKKLRFDISQTWSNLTAEKLMTKVEEEANNEKHKDSTAFIMVILSHGVRGYVYGTDGKKVLIEDIITKFNSKNCPNLDGKPKLFLIQACQGVESSDIDDDGVDGGIGDGDDISTRLQDLRLTDNQGKAPISLPYGPFEGNEMTDYCIAYATAPGHTAWRNKEKGTWFVREFVKVCIESAHKEEIKEIFRLVRCRVKDALALLGKGQVMPLVECMEKQFYFFPGLE